MPVLGFVHIKVKWRNQDVIVSDPLSTSDFKEGDAITFMTQKIDLPSANVNKDDKIKTLSFQVVDFPNLVPKK